MSRFQSTEENQTWEKAQKLRGEVSFRLSQGLFADTFSDQFGLSRQISRTIIELQAHLAESFEEVDPEKIKLALINTKESVDELIAQFYAALNHGYLDKKTFNDLFVLAKETEQMVQKVKEKTTSTDYELTAELPIIFPPRQTSFIRHFIAIVLKKRKPG